MLKYRVERSLSPETDFATLVELPLETTTYVDTAVVVGTPYFYRIRTFDPSGVGTPSPALAAVALAAAIPPPNDPTLLIATTVDAFDIALSWTNNGGGAASLTVEQSPDGLTGWTTIATLGGTATATMATGLTPDTTYSFRVTAVNATGPSGPSNVASATTSSQLAPPAAVTNLIATAVSAFEIDLAWTDNSSTETGFIVERSPNGTTGWILLTTTAPDVTTYANTGLAAATAYFYRVRATNAVGDAGNSNVASATTQAAPVTIPDPPSTLIAAAASSTQINLAWVDASGNETGFQVERSLSSSSGFALVTTTAANATGYANTGLNPSTTYYFRVRATNAAGSSSYSNVASATTAAAVVAGPPAPGNLAITALSPTEAQFSLATNVSALADFTLFAHSSDGGITWLDADKFKVVYNTTPTGANAASWIKAGLTPGATYHFRAANATEVPADRSVIEGAPSNVVGPVTMPSAKLAVTAPAALTVTVNSACSATIAWTNSTFRKEDGFQLERSSDGGSTWTVVAPNLYRGARYFTDNGLAASTTYKWRLTAFNGRTQTGPLSATFLNSDVTAATSGDTTPAASGSAPAAPSLLTALAYSDTVVSLEWQLNGQTEAGTQVEYSTDGGSTYSPLFTVGRWIWSCYVTGLTAATAYSFRVRTTNAGGTSSYATPATVTTLVSGHTFTNDLALAPVAPKLFLSPQQLAVWRQMQTDWHSGAPTSVGGTLYGRVKTIADWGVTYLNTGVVNSQQYYLDAWGDIGFYAALMYQLTGTAAYAQAAYNLLVTNVNQTTALGAALTLRPVYKLRGAPAANFISTALPQIQVMYDWCASGWTSLQKATIQDGIKAWMGYLNGWNGVKYSGGARVGVTQETNVNSFVTGYITLALWDTLNADSTAGSWTLQSQFIPMGGIQPSIGTQNGTRDWLTYANEAMGVWALDRSGGNGVESSEYDAKANFLFTLATEVLRQTRSLDADNCDYLPLARTASRLSGLGAIHKFSADAKQVYQSGDEGNPYALGGNGYIREEHSSLALAGNASAGNATIGPVVQGFALELYNKAGASPWLGSTQPYWYFFLGINPYHTTAARTTLPKGFLDPVQGVTRYHTGYTNSDAFFSAHMLRNNNTDHQPFYFGDFQLHRKGEWALTHPVWYGDLGNYPEAANAMMLAGLGAMGQVWSAPSVTNGIQRSVAQAFDTGPDYAYSCGETYGPYYGSPVVYGGLPPAFCYEWTRSVVFLPSSDGKSDTVVTFDRTFAANPSYLPDGGTTGATGLAFYRASGNIGAGGLTSDRTRITANPVTNVPLAANAAVPSTPGTPALEQWILHCATLPTIVANVATWTTVGATNYPAQASNLKLVNLLPAAAILASYDEQTLFSPPYARAESQLSKVSNGQPYSPVRRWQLREWPATPWPSNSTPRNQVFCNVIFATDVSGGPTTSATLVQDDSTAIVAGPRISRTGLNDVLMLFSQVPSHTAYPSTVFGRVLSSGYTVTVTTTTATTDVLLFDLAPGHSWTSTLDGGSPVSLAVNDQGVGKLTIAGAGAHTLVLA